ncbi:plasmid pRiA4b ORF-3 family protein [Zhaonella formicivorans]|uniref:plasmid pRiA4b ORF-3 family protein n=1 Tax=Zhaonella formicivorans TaxID=2528593 RepID=UPI001D10D287|nr:plasmid pRiA4b ORF-3 family protein [Zhaonella formicivorans]
MKAYQIKIELIDSEPLIWRRVVIPADVTFRRRFSGFSFLKKLKTRHAIYNFNRITGSTFRALPIINSHFSAPLCYDKLITLHITNLV